MSFDSADRRKIREYVGAEPDDYQLDLVGGDNGWKITATALSILKTRRATIVSAPADWGTDGYSEEWSENLKALDADIEKLEAEIAVESDTDVDLAGSGPVLTPARFRVPRDRLFSEG